MAVVETVLRYWIFYGTLKFFILQVIVEPMNRPFYDVQTEKQFVRGKNNLSRFKSGQNILRFSIQEQDPAKIPETKVSE